MYRPGNQLFPGSTLALNENRRITGSSHFNCPKHLLHNRALADNVIQAMKLSKPEGNLFRFLTGPDQFGHIGDRFDHTYDLPALFPDHTGMLDDRNIMSALMLQLALLRTGRSFFEDPALANVGGTCFAKTAAACQKGAGLSQCFVCGVTAYSFHGPVPGYNFSVLIKDKDTICH